MSKIEKSQHSRVIIGSVFGIMFFGIWPFIVFYMRIYNHDEVSLWIAYFIVSILSVVISFVLARIKRYKLQLAIIMFITFVLSMVIVYSEKNKLKNYLAIYSGYFNDEASQDLPENRGQRLIYSARGYTVSLNNLWVKQTDKGPMFEYFNLINNGDVVAEFRPKCASDSVSTLPEIVEDIKDTRQDISPEVDVTCMQTKNSIYSCRLDFLDQEDMIKRIRWFALDKQSNHSVELDFVIFSEQASSINEIERVIYSMTFTYGYQATSKCLGLTEWM